MDLFNFDTFTICARYWLFGEKLQDLPQSEESLYRLRGWFPRRCALEVPESGDQREKKIK
jgi:hypothetical protein